MAAQIIITIVRQFLLGNRMTARVLDGGYTAPRLFRSQLNGAKQATVGCVRAPTPYIACCFLPYVVRGNLGVYSRYRTDAMESASTFADSKLSPKSRERTERLSHTDDCALNAGSDPDLCRIAWTSFPLHARRPKLCTRQHQGPGRGRCTTLAPF